MRNRREKHFIVCKCFLRVIKNHHLFPQFKQSFKSFRIPSDYSNRFEKGNLIVTMDFINHVAENDYRHHRRDPNDKYENITFIINTLLRFFVEKMIKDTKNRIDIGMLGQEIFDLACYNIYGEEFLDDMEKMNQGMPQPKSNKDLFLISMYRDFLRSNPNISYNDFIDTYGDDLINKFNELQRHGSW